MNRRTLVLAAVLTLTAANLLTGVARAQNGSAQPANAPGSAPAQSTAANTSTGSSSTANPATPSKKVWTNEDMGAIHSNSAISTFSSGANKPANAKLPATAKPSSKSTKQYQDQITKLQAKLPPLDEQISVLQAGLNGATINETRHYGGVKLDDWRDQLARLQKQREDIAEQISAMQDEARHNGVPDNQIP